QDTEGARVLREQTELTPQTPPSFGEAPEWQPIKPRWHPVHLAVSWVLAAASLYLAAGIVRRVNLDDPGGAFVVAGAIGVLNAVLPPVIAALRLPFTLLFGFVLVLFADAAALMIADDLL